MSAGFLLDTNVVSELRKGARADAGVRAWFDEHTTDQLWLSVLVVGELRRGVELLRRRDKRAGKRLSDWLATITTEYGDRIIPITTAVCERWALLNVPDPVPVIDGLLAATALERDLVLVTRNTVDVERTGVALVNPFRSADLGD
jgi:predicted nucleic acid-binding protein